MVGVTVGNYKLTAKLGEGGMGSVYVAEHTLLGRKAALKMIRPEYSKMQDVVTRFFNEAKATAQIKHPCIVEIYDFGYHTDGSAYIAMEYLDGEPLSTRLRRERRLTSAQIVAISRQICSALKAAHDKGIVHRDLKPDNIFIVPDSEAMSGERVKVLDFGIAKLNDEGVSKTRTGTLMGTPLYMSPEQCRGAQLVDWRSDIYSLGCIMFEMATGRPPFIGEGFGQIIAAQMMEQPPTPTSIEPTVPPPIEEIIMRALSKKPEERQQSMAEIAGSLDGLFSGRYSTGRMFPMTGQTGNMPAMTPPSSTTPGTTTSPGARPTTLRSASGEVMDAFDDAGPSKSRRGALFAAVAAVVLVGGGVGIVMKMNRSAAAPAEDKGETRVVKKDDPPPAPPAIVNAAPPVKVKLHIESEPAGAQVFRGADGVLVGTTPFDQELDKSAGQMVYVVKQDGYEDAHVQLPIDKDGSQTVTLVKVKHHTSHAATKNTTDSGKGGKKSVLIDPFK